MNQLEAARETVAMMRDKMEEMETGPFPPRRAQFEASLQPDHIEDMLNQMEADKNPQGGKFSDAKMGRWLGWIQAAVVAMGYATLEDMKNINGKWSSK